MFYRMRRSDGSTTAYSAGTFVAANGRAEALAASDVAIEVLAEWPSPLDGARYPARWRVRLPRRSLTVEVAPVLADQELNVSVRYWEGAVSVRGSAGDRAVRGRGYVELTGYAGGSRPGTAPLQPMR
jgi:predicted secreted hydrolase